MRKIIPFLALVIGVCLESCMPERYPFHEVSKNIIDYFDAVMENPLLKDDDAYFKIFMERQKTLSKDLYGKTIPIEIDDGLGLEIVDHIGEIGEGEFESDDLNIPICFKLRITDTKLASKNLQYCNLMAILFDDQNVGTYSSHISEEEIPLRANVSENFSIDVDTSSVNETSPVLYEQGRILNRGINIHIEAIDAQQLLNVTKMVIMKTNFDTIIAIERKNNEKRENFIKQLEEKLR